MNNISFEFLKSSLDNLHARVMIADNERNIIYINPSVIKFLKEVEQDIKRELPSFSVDKLIGTNIDNFHKNPSHQADMLSKLTSHYDTSIKIGRHTFNLRAAPLFKENGERLGTHVEWEDSVAFEAVGQDKAINRSLAVIEFNPEGIILNANQNFLDCMGYELNEIQGKHHRIFVDPKYAESDEYKEFWKNLGEGKYDKRFYKRFGKNGKVVLINASYNPIVDSKNNVFKIVKYAIDVSEIVETGIIAEKTIIDVKIVAEDIEKMTNSIDKISSDMKASEESVSKIGISSNESSQAAKKLQDSMKMMENVIDMISSIAGQVNLLALNATIEAARAGEAGRGFAVVAGEVKNLAAQTKNATEQISSQIKEVQNVSENVNETIDRISASAEEVKNYVVSVANALKEQNSVIHNISGNTKKMAASVDDIVKRIKKLAKNE